MPEESQLAAFYPKDYHSMERRGHLTNFRHDMRIRRLLGVLGQDEGPVLDHGCGDGSFLVRAATRMPNRALFGYEISGERRVERHADGQVTIVRGSFNDLLDVLPPCRLITMNHVVEHLPDPFSVLTAMRARLLPGGIFDGQTPAASSLEQRVFGKRWSGYHAPRHTVVFSPKGLGRMLERAGFGDVRIASAFNPAAIAVSLASLTQPADAPGRIRRSGPAWLMWLALATAVAPIDLGSGAGGIMNFHARRTSN
jgi:hypothetical protein